MDVSNILNPQTTALHRLSCRYRLFLVKLYHNLRNLQFYCCPPQFYPHYTILQIYSHCNTICNVAGPSSLDLEASSGDKSRPGILMGSPDSCDKRPSVRPPAPVSHVSRLARAPQADPLNRTSTINYPSTRRCPESLMSHPCVSQWGGGLSCVRHFLTIFEQLGTT